MMLTTSTSLLQRLRGPEPNGAWERLVKLYTPLLYFWARKLGLQEQDAADLVQEVLLLLVRKLPEFEYEPGKSFRGWLRTVLINKSRDRKVPVPTEPLDSGAAPAVADAASLLEESEYRSYLVNQALRLMQTDFEPSTWQACWRTVVEGRPVAEVAAELGLSVNAVYLARSRVLGQLRRELQGLLD